MKRKHQKTLELIFTRPVSANIKWADIEGLFIELGAELSEWEGSRVGVRLFGERRVFHRPQSAEDLQKLVILNQRRLQVLQEQQAQSGNSTEPKIVLEIENIETKLEQLQSELDRLH